MIRESREPLTNLYLLAARAWNFLTRPQSAWQSLGPPPGAWYLPLLYYVLPLALLPALGWALGTAYFPIADSTAINPVAQPSGIAFIAALFELVSKTALLYLISVVLLATAIFCVSPMYRVARDWTRSVEIAAYGSTPMLLAGVLLLWQILIVVSLVAFIPSCYVVYLGLQIRLACHHDAAIGFVAVAMVVAILVSMLFGALMGALGLV